MSLITVELPSNSLFRLAYLVDNFLSMNKQEFQCEAHMICIPTSNSLRNCSSRGKTFTYKIDAFFLLYTGCTNVILEITHLFAGL